MCEVLAGCWRAELKCVRDLTLPLPPPLPSCPLTYMQFQEAMKEQHSRYFVVTAGADELSVGGELAEGTPLVTVLCCILHH